MIYKTSFTAGFASLTKSLNLISFNLAFLLALNKVPYSTMSAWQQEKDKFLSIPLEEKRKHYRDFKTLKDIPTWKEYASTVTLPPAKPMLANCTIDDTLNSVLASKVSLYRGDITKLEVDCIVNAANKTLLGGGGVDGFIHRNAGKSLVEECRTLNGCETGQAKITGGYKLPAKYVIHTVGPVGEKPGLLQQCYRSSLELMLSKKLRSIAFPCISTGIFGYPIEPASHIAAYEVRKHLEKDPDAVDRVIFCVFLPEDEPVYQQLLQSYFPLN